MKGDSKMAVKIISTGVTMVDDDADNSDVSML